VDEQRNPQDATEQESEPAPARPKTMFDRDDEREARDEMVRFARRRAAIWGLAGGVVMSLILVLCAVLIYLLGTR
jgi:hypothetical protein